jgi:multidrug efflux pump subunit AcrB
MNKKDHLHIFFKKISGIFIVNRELGILLVLFIVFFGLVGFVMMPKQYNPEIVAPAFRINTEFPHATTEDVYELVSRPLENKISELEGVDEIYSESREGISSVLVTFDIGFNKEDAKINLVQRLRSNMDEKPLGAEEPFIEEVDTDDVPVVTVALTSNDLSSETLRSFAFDLADRLKHVSGTAKTVIRGGYRADLSIFVDVEKMERFGIGVNDLQKVIKDNNLHTLSVSTDSDPYNISVRTLGNIVSLDELKKIVISHSGGGVVRIEDVAQVSVGEMRTNHYVKLSDREGSRDAVYIGIAKKSNENATTVSKDIHKEVKKLQEYGFIPHNITLTTVRDDGAVAQDEIGSLTRSLAISITIVVSILLFFLNARSALIVAIAIPLSLLSVFGLGLLFDQTINRITLFALILSLGLLVDNATVVIENIYRHLKMKKSEDKKEVITDAVAEVGSGLVMSTITTILAFIPMAFVTGMMGPYMGPIPFFVPVAIVASLFIALMVSPFMSHIFLQVDHAKDGALVRLQNKIQSIFTKIEDVYVHFLRAVFRKKKKRTFLFVAVFILLLISISLPLFTLVKFRMLPKADRNQFYVYIDANDGTHIDRANRIAEKVEYIILEQNDVVNVQRTVGVPPIVDFNGLFKGSDGRIAENLVTLKVNLIDKNERKRTSENIAMQIRSLLKNIALDEDVNIKIIEDPPGPPVLATYHIKVQGDGLSDYEYLKNITHDLMYASRNIRGVVDLDTTQNENGFERTYRVNTEKATHLGVSVEDIFMTMRVLSRGMNIDLYHNSSENISKFSEQHYISLISEKNDRSLISDMSRVTVRSQNGSLVALTELIEEDAVQVDNIILMDGQYPTVYISGEMEDRSVVYASIDMLKYLLSEYRLPSGKGYVDSWDLFGVNYVDSDGSRYYVRIGGEWQLTLEVFRDMGIAFSVAIFLIYFVLVAQFHSLRIPLYIMATIPLSLIGVLPGFMILYFFKGTYFNATSMIGVIALSGIVVNNAIIYLEYFLYKRNEGMKIDDALIEAGRTRLLPIVLTSLTTIFGSLTIITDPVWEGLAWAIITGLSLSSFLTLVILPVLYRTFEKDKIFKKV